MQATSLQWEGKFETYYILDAEDSFRYPVEDCYRSRTTPIIIKKNFSVLYKNNNNNHQIYNDLTVNDFSVLLGTIRNSKYFIENFFLNSRKPVK